MIMYVYALFIGITIGWASAMLNRKLNTPGQWINVVVSASGAVLLSLLIGFLGIAVSIPITAGVGSVGGLVMLLLFRKPSSENKQYYL